MDFDTAKTYIKNKHKKEIFVDKRFAYSFFLVHLLVFTSLGFYIAYSGKVNSWFGFFIAAFGIFWYVVVYVQIFGVDKVKWLVINTVLGIIGVSNEIDFILYIWNKKFEDYSYVSHFIPFSYYILYTFLIRQIILDLTNSRKTKIKKRIIEYLYIIITLAVYVLIYIRN